MKYLKLFNQSSEYNSFKESDEFVLPNVSFVKESNIVSYETLPEPQAPKNFIKFAPYSTDVSPESFTPQPISIDAVDDGGIIVFDDNVTEISVGMEALAYAGINRIEFCENVRSISSYAFDGCEYTEIKFHSIVPPEFIDGVGQLGSSLSFNGIIYYPAGSDYSSLRSVTTDMGHRLLFENFEFVEFNPSPSPKPEQPEDSVIEYHFEIPMNDATTMGIEYQEGEIEGDFAELVEKLYKYAMKNGTDTGYSFDIDTWPEEDIKITVNGDLANHALCAYYDENGNINNIDILTNGTAWPMEEARLLIYPTKAVYSEGK